MEFVGNSYINGIPEEKQMKKLIYALKKVIAEKTFDCSNYDVEVTDYDELSFEKGFPETKSTPSTSAIKKVRINSIFIAGLFEEDEIQKGDKLKFNFTFVDEDGFKYYIKNEIATVDQIELKPKGFQIEMKDFYISAKGNVL